MRPWMTHAIALGAAVGITWLGRSLDWYWMGVLAGALLAHAMQDAGAWLVAQSRPATKHERRLAKAVESAVRQRTLTIDRDTGEHKTAA